MMHIGTNTLRHILNCPDCRDMVRFALNGGDPKRLLREAREARKKRGGSRYGMHVESPYAEVKA
jgi:hypothetical protein